MKIDSDVIASILDNKYSLYRVEFPNPILDSFDSLSDAYYHSERLFRGNRGVSCLVSLSLGFRIASTVRDEHVFLESFGGIENPIEYILDGETKLDLEDDEQSSAYYRLFYQSLRNSLTDQGFALRGNTAIDESVDLIGDLPRRSTDTFVRQVAPFLHLHPAFRFMLRHFGSDWYLQISPKTTLDFDKDLNYLLSEQRFTSKQIIDHFEWLSLSICRSARLSQVLGKTAHDPIDEKPFFGGSFLDFAKQMYPTANFLARDAPLLIVVPYGNRSVPWYFSSEGTRPSISFSELAHLDYDIFSKIQSEMKIQSARREESLQKYLHSLNLEALGHRISFSGIHRIEAGIEPIEITHFDRLNDFSCLSFPDPWFSWKNRVTGQIIEVHKRFTRHIGAPQDLMRDPDLACLETPEELRLKVVCHEPLAGDASNLLEALREESHGYRGFQSYFGSKLTFESIELVEDLAAPSAVFDDVSPEKYDCVIVFGPRRVLGSHTKTLEVYTSPEKQALNRGVPAQFVADERSENPARNLSLKVKGSSPNTLFGIGLNIMGKVGAKVFSLGKNTTDFFLPNSSVIGFNVTRIFKTLESDTSQAESPRELVKTSTPLAAPLVLMSGIGDEIIQQDAFELPDEASLFKGERAHKILAPLEGISQNVLVHKDGPFFQGELEDISKLQRNDLTVVPVSVVSGLSPRIFSSLAHMKHLPRPGMVIPLDNISYLMSTPLVNAYYDAGKRGWPNTIMVSIHDKILRNPLHGEQKLRILYQIWSLTRAHMGSQIPTREPLSIHYANLMSEFLRKVGNPQPAYFKEFKGRRNRIGFVPRPFL